MPARALDYSGRDRPAGRECLVAGQVLRVVGQVAHARLHAGSPVIGQPARIGLRGDRLGDMPGPAGQHRQRLDGHPVLSGWIIPGMEAPRGGPHVLLLSTGPRPALIDVIDDREDRVLAGRVRAAVGSPAAAGALGPGRGQAVAATRAGDDEEQGEDRAEQQADGRGGEGDRLHGQGGRLPDAVSSGGYLLPGGHGLARGELAEYAQHLGELRVGPEQAGLDPVQLALLVVAKAHNMLLNCGIAAGAGSDCIVS